MSAHSGAPQNADSTNGASLAEFDPAPFPAPAGSAPESVLGERLKAARDHFGLSVDALSRLTKAWDEQEAQGVSSTALLRYEAGKALPAARELRLLCDALGMSAHWLIFGTVPDEGVTPTEQSFLAAFRALQRANADESAMGEGMALTVRYQVRSLRWQRLTEARKRS